MSAARPPAIVLDPAGVHNADLTAARGRLIQGRSYRDLSTVCLIPAIAPIPPRVVQSWLGLMTPMNQRFFRIFLENMEVGDAYNAGVETVLANPELSKYPYILTLETDNMPPPDGLLKLYESIRDLDAVGGLYWTKGPGGQPMIYGAPSEHPKNFRPQLPVPGTLQPANGLGMGFTLFRTAMFASGKLPKPWFKTEQSFLPGVGARAYTQDLYFFEHAGKHGYRFACDTRVTVGHWDEANQICW